MGLAINVGVLADLLVDDPEGAGWLRESLARANEVLSEEGLPEHQEPETVPRMTSRAGVCGFPYSFLHYLRRAYAHTVNDPDWIATPTADGEDLMMDEVIEEESSMLESHLLCHSDCEGFYLPIDFSALVIDQNADGENGRIEGGLLGSSYRLREELIEVAPKLGITLESDALSDGEAARINASVSAEEEFWIEKMVWICLFEAARLSIAHRTAICFG